MNVLLTGSTGFLGRWVAAVLEAAGLRVSTYPGRLLASPTGTARSELHRLLRESRVVCHLAGATTLHPGPPTSDAYRRGNIEATRSLLAAMASAGTGHVVLASTAMVGGLSPAVGRPDSNGAAYAESKVVAEGLVGEFTRNHGTGTILRFNTLGGPGNTSARGIVAAALAAARDGSPFPVYSGGSTGRDYLHVVDAASAAVGAIFRPRSDLLTVEIGSGKLSTVEEVLVAAECVTGRSIRREFLPPRADVADRPACDLGVAGATLGWSPSGSDLETIVRDQWLGRSSVPVRVLER